jgi:hypothetical protein
LKQEETTSKKLEQLEEQLGQQVISQGAKLVGHEIQSGMGASH